MRLANIFHFNKCCRRENRIFAVSETSSLRRRGIPKSSRANLPELRISFSFFLCLYIENATKLRKIDTLAKTGKIEGNCATRVRKNVQFLEASLMYKLCILFFACYVSRICSVYVSLFRTQGNSISHWLYLKSAIKPFIMR